MQRYRAPVFARIRSLRDRSYSIRQRWKEEVIYQEGDREFVFSAGWGVTPPVGEGVLGFPPVERRS